MNTLLGFVLIVVGVGVASIALILTLWRERRPARKLFKASSMRLLRKGLSCFMNNDIKGAIDNLNKSIAIDPDNGRCHEYLSFAYAQCGHYHLAKKHAGIALEFNSEYFAHISNSMIFRYKLELKKSLEEARKAIEIDYDIYHGHYWAGMACADLGKFREALAECRIVRMCDVGAAKILYKYIKNLEAIVSGKDPDVVAEKPRGSEKRPAEITFVERTPDEPETDNGGTDKKQYDSYEPREKFSSRAAQGMNDFDEIRRGQSQGGAKVSENFKTSLEYAEYCSALELSPSATRSEIRDSYRTLVKVWHPDRFAHDRKLQEFAQQKLTKINDAYRRLMADL
jgi:tetratricopeptide (TPR) repeat protein